MKVLTACMVTSACLGLAGDSFAGAALDTSYCWPTVIIREAVSGRLLAGSVTVYRLEPGAPDSVRWVTHERDRQTYPDGTAEVPALAAGRYLVGVSGSADERPLADWQPPPGPGPREVAVGHDPWRRPTQVRSFEGWSEWEVTHGSCADSLVVRVEPGEWVTVLPGERLELCRHFPPGYRANPRKEGRPRSRRP